MVEESIREFIARWRASGGSEQANSQLFLGELCDVLGVDRPEPATPELSGNAYVFERPVEFRHSDGTTSRGRIDLYKRGCFVLESKQGTLKKEKEKRALSKAVQEEQASARKGVAVRGTKNWDEAMLRARGQADRYIRNLPAEEGRPPFLIVVDVGHSIELYSEFTCTGGTYTAFPEAGTHRIFLDDLLDPAIRERLRLVWTDPHALDPSRRAAKVTREIATSLAKLAKSLEQSGNAPEDVAHFLMRCLFTMFAEDVGLLSKDSFTNLLESMRADPDQFVPLVEELWAKMNTGGFSTAIREQVKRFNGGLFAEIQALPLNRDQVELLLESARADWCDVEPAIFGTLLERALDSRERHKLGAHYTPRAYVERLVMPTIIDPLREEWNEARTAAVAYMRRDDYNKAVDRVRTFHRKLCKLRVLDPACGSGNFLYVTLEHLKRLEGEVLDLEQNLGMTQIQMEGGGLKVDPHQLLGLEINPRAAAIAELVLWIGYLQWHFRTMKGVAPAEPIIQDFRNIECRDALIEYDERVERLDEDGQPVTIWDGRTTKTHPATGKEVPNEEARLPVYDYVNPRQAEWPKADYVVGNPPFIGAAVMRSVLGDGYVETLRRTYDKLPASCDFVMYWWNQAARLVRASKLTRFGFISTNSIKQSFNRRVIQTHMQAATPVGLAFAIPDHPWVDSADGADVRIAMTVGRRGKKEGRLVRVVKETKTGMERDVVLEEQEGVIHSDLTIGIDVSNVDPLKANSILSNRGVQLMGSGFIVSREEATNLGLGTVSGIDKHIREYRHGRDLTSRPRGVMVIDLFGLEKDEVRKRFPALYQWVVERVKPERDQNKRKSYRDSWWIFGEPRGLLRPALKGLPRYIATVETSKHRFFTFLDASILPDNMLVVVASEDAYHLGVLSCRLHVLWALATGGTLEDRPRYNKTRCFETFPFPAATKAHQTSIRDITEELDGLRKRQLDAHPDLTMTGMYNVLEALREGRELTPKERDINDKGLVTTLKDLHDRLDAAVLDAYGWPYDLDDQAILQRLVDINAERAAEEARGKIRWLRPEYQAPKSGVEVKQASLGVEFDPAKIEKLPWPKPLEERTRAVLAALDRLGRPGTMEEVAQQYKYAHRNQVQEILDTLAALGQIDHLDGDRYAKH